MNWLYETLWQHTPVQAVVIICLICALGLALGKLRFRGISLGVTYVFFIGILFGALGLELDAQMLSYAESFGLILFVYTLGLHGRVLPKGFVKPIHLNNKSCSVFIPRDAMSWITCTCLCDGTCTSFGSMR